VKDDFSFNLLMRGGTTAAEARLVRSDP